MNSQTQRPTLETLEDRLVPATVPAGFVEAATITGLVTPTAMHQASNGDIFVAQQSGALRVVDNGVLQATPFVTLNVDASGERGLLGVTTDPDFASNNFVYVYYTVPGSPAHNRVSRFTANGNVASGGETILFELDDLAAAGNHNAGAIHFGPDGLLYIATGDAGTPGNSQTLTNTHGKLLRIHADGTIPDDNPFLHVTSGNDQAIWALGLRNPFTFAFDPDDGRVYVNDVGQSAFEEINQGAFGANFGWSLAEGFGGAPAFTDPLLAYGHAIGPDAGFAIAGAAFYRPTTDQFPSSPFEGDYFYSDFAVGWIRHYDAETGTSTPFAAGFVRPVDLLVSPNGSLFVLTRGDGTTPAQLTRIDFINNLTAEQRYVQTLYNDFLGRAGTFAEVSSWVSLLPSLGLRGVVQGIGRSPEALGRVVDGVYVSLLGRTAEASGKATWMNFLAGNTLESLLAQILSSGEFANRANALIGEPNANANFVKALYRELLGRDASAGEVNSWLIQLGTGVPRGTVVFGFVNSPEFRTGSVHTFYGDPAQGSRYQTFFANLLRRTTTPASAEVAGYVNNGVDLLTIQLNIAASPESFGRRVS